MAIDIMVNNDLKVRPIGLIPTGNAPLESLNFNVINSACNNSEVYLILKGELFYDVLRLNPVKPFSQTHTIYRIAAGQKVRIKDGEPASLRLMFFSKDIDNFRTTDSFAIKVKTSEYNLARQIAIAQEIHNTVSQYYEEIVNMYQELKKGDIVNDNQD